MQAKLALIDNSNVLKIAPKRFIFALMEDFSMLSFAGAIDALRIANRASPSSYQWVLTSETGGAVSCSANISYNVDSSFMELKKDDTIVICGGINIQKA